MRTSFSIRTKLLLVALLLLLIPWMSYIYVRDMKAFLLSGQEDALSLTSRAIATVLHDRPELFTEDSQSATDLNEDNDIYAFPLPNYINLNGDLSDWGEQIGQADLFTTTDTHSDASQSINNIIQIKHLLGYHGRYIYGMFNVKDDYIIFRQPDFLRLDAEDHVRLTLQEPGLQPRRFILSAHEAGRMSIYLVDDEWRYPVTGAPNYDLAAYLKVTDQGYNIELRIPRFILTTDTRIRLSVVDVDDLDSLTINAIVPTTPDSDNDDLSRLLVQSPEIAKILSGLDRDDTRVWVLDKEKNIRTVVGNIITDENQLDRPVKTGKTFDYIWSMVRYYYSSALQAIFNLIVDNQNANSDNSQRTVEERNDAIIAQALDGKISSDRRPSIDDQGTILMSAHPVFLGGNILGAVIVEQSTNPVLRQQQDVLENVISVTLLVLVTVATALLIFASRLTLRIRRLASATDNAIDRDGRIINQKLSADQKAGDEIGDLSRSVSNMLGRLSQYTNYLRGLPDTLAHEVSNPLNVVNSSLHNLSQESPEIANSKYMSRAKNGINRIGAILRNLTEAANLEQAMQSETRETIDLIELIKNYMDGYAISNPDQAFTFEVLTQPLMVDGAPDYIAQLFDKLVDNAIDFAAPETAIVFKARRVEQMAQIDVINQGSSLPDNMAERIFEPLVSLGRKDAQKTRLGMGLYVVKLIASFHGGDVIARNLSNNNGVIFTISLPIHSDHVPIL